MEVDRIDPRRVHAQRQLLYPGLASQQGFRQPQDVDVFDVNAPGCPGTVVDLIIPESRQVYRGMANAQANASLMDP